jgi:type IV pilus assembly protein PilZ
VSQDPPPSDPAAERRNRGRYEVEWAVDCVTEATFLYAAITNISEMGIFVACESPFEVGTQLSLRFQPRPNDEAFLVPGRVQWVNVPKPFGHCRNPGMGIQFIDLSRDARQRIVEIIRTMAYVNDFSN